MKVLDLIVLRIRLMLIAAITAINPKLGLFACRRAAALSIKALILLFLVAVVGLALTPTITSSVTSAAVNMTGAALQLMNLFPLFWVILMIAIPVAGVTKYLVG
jgi:hypothetical protein